MMRGDLVWLSFAASAILACAPPPPRPAPQPAAPTPLYVCAPEQPSDWLTGWTSHASWVLSDLGTEAGLRFEPSPMGYQACRSGAGRKWAGIGCYGAPGAVYCDAATLARVGAVAALLAPVIVRWVSQKGPRPSARMARVLAHAAEADALDRSANKQQAERVPVVGGWFMTRHQLDGASMDHVFESLQWSQAMVPPLAEPLQIHRTYRRIVMLALGFVVGHEMMHAEKTCSHPASVEAGLRLNELATAQSEGTGTCPADLDPDEMAADLCGLGVVERLSRAEPRSRLDAASRQMAVELISVLAELGLGDPLKQVILDMTHGDTGVLSVSTTNLRVRPGYLYPQSRLSLFASTLEGADAKLCGETGWAYVSLVRDLARGCAKKRPGDDGAPWTRFVSDPIAKRMRDPSFVTGVSGGDADRSAQDSPDLACPALP